VIDYQKEFKLIPNYINKLKEVDQNITIKLEQSNSRFIQIFICPSTAKNAFKFCRKFIAIDITFLKTVYKQNLLLAATKDSDNNLLLIA